MVLVKVFYFVIFTTALILGSMWLVVAETSISEVLEEDPITTLIYQDWEQRNITREIDLQAQPKYKAMAKHVNKYFLYTRYNPHAAEDLYEDNLASIRGSAYNPADQTVLIVHDWNGSVDSKLNPAIRDAFLGAIYANIIVVDWSAISTTDYVTASSSVSRVGRCLGQFLRFLNSNAGSSYGTMHLVGYGLGAHIAGNAANFLQPSGRVARITGLDPSGPLWSNNTKRLKPQNAVYVEVIHTDNELLGSDTRFGHVDFYPNGGSSQPGCPAVSKPNSCSHMRSWQLFAATVKHNHLVGRRCANTDALGLNMCYHNYLPMGNDDLLKNGSGIYRVATGAKYPYLQIF